MMEKKRIFRVAFLLLPLLFFSLSSFGQALTVRGSVKSEKGEGLPGVTVVVKGTTTGSITDINGDYQVNVPSQEAILSYSCIGFETQEINVGTQTTINVIMKEETLGLKEIVVVGYGNQRREAVTGSVASIKGDVVRDIPASNITQALQGRVSGVEMSQTSTKPGAQMQIRIRGTRSLNANNDPLVVLDGIPFSGSIGDINLNDIKSIDILKDASATAIYGSRGANGVILVSTNKGAKGQKAQFSYNGYHGVQTIFAKYPMMNGPEYVALRKAAGKYSNTVDEADNVDTDWQDLLYRTGMVSSHDISVAGGTEKGNYKFGVGYYTEEAVVPLQDYTRYALSGSLDQEIGKLFRVGFTTNNSFSINNGNNLGAVGNALARSPIANPYKEDGTLKDIIQEQTSGAQWVSTRERLEGLGDKYIDQQKAFGSYNSIFAEVKIPGIEGLKYRVNLGLSFRMKNSGSYTGQGVFSGNPLTVSTASVGNELTTNWAVENMLTYDRKIGKHQFNVVGLYSAEESRFNSSSVNAKDIPADNLQFYNLGLANGEISVNRDYQGYSVSGLMSYMGRVMYSFNDRYMLSATFRSDGSSRLAKGHKWHTYPAVSAGWNLMKEAFMADVTKVDMLKLRVGYGQTSNQSVEPYKTLGLLSTRPYNFGNTY
jgi:TonB-linked SusC/RagA family outer membrane protein